MAARLLGLVVDTFSIGFGPALWKKRHKGITYKIGCIPFGGYVALPQLDPSGMSLIQSEQDADGDGKGQTEGEAPSVTRIPRAPAWKKIIVSLAGAAGNMVLAVVVAWVVYWVGMPAGPAERSAVVGYADPACAAYEKGLRIGDEIVAVDDVVVTKWREFIMEAALRGTVTLQVRSPTNGLKTITVPTEKGMLGEQTVAGIDGRNLCLVLSVEKGMSAAQAGILSGDTIVEFAGQDVWSREHLIALVDEHRDQPTSIKVMREVDGELALVAMDVTPALDVERDRARIGIAFNMAAVELDTVIRPKPSAQLVHHASAIFRFLRALVTPNQAKAASSAVGGPVAIIISYWYIVKTSICLAIWFTGFLNVNLAIINLLPIPVLDGGHIVFSLWELVTRRAVSARVVNVLVNVFAVLIIGLFLLLSVRDMDRMTRVGGWVRGLFKGMSEQVVTPESSSGSGDQPESGGEGAVTNAP